MFIFSLVNKLKWKKNINYENQLFCMSVCRKETETTEEYAELIYNFIMEFLRYLQKEYSDAIGRSTIHPYCHKQATFHMTMSTMISISHDAEMCDYTEAKETLKIRRFGIVK